MENQGYISIHRKILKWEWYDDANTMRIFFHLLLTVNHEDGKWHGIEIKRGQRITSLEKLASELHLSIQNVRTSISHLKSTGELTSNQHAKFSLITVLKYNDYQVTNRLANKKLTSNQQATNKQLTTNNNNNNNNNEKKRYLDYVLLSDVEYEKLKIVMGNEREKYIENLRLYIESKGDKYKSHYATMLTWWKKDHPEIKCISSPNPTT